MLWAPTDEQRPVDKAVEPESLRSTKYEASQQRQPRQPNEPHRPAPLQFQDVVGILHRRSRMIITVAIIGAVLTTVVGLLIPPKYSATSELAVEAPQGAGSRVLSATEESSIDTHVALASSHDQLERVAESLVKDPEFLATLPAGLLDNDVITGAMRPRGVEKNGDPAGSHVNQSILGDVAQRLRIWVGLLSRREHGLALIVEQLDRNAKIMQARRSRIIKVSYTSTNPQQAAIVANRIVQLYADNQGEQKRASMRLEEARLGERIAELKKGVDAGQTAAQVLIAKRAGTATVSERDGKDADSRLREVQRDTASGGQLYLNLMRRQEEVRGQLEFVTPDVNVASLASTPQRPSSSNPLLFILPAIIICMISASLAAVIFDRLDHGIRSERDINDMLGIPCIGLVPQLPQKLAGRPDQHLLAEPYSAYAEAIRSMVATLQITSHLRSPKVVLISSSVPMEGKTTLALSLATYVARLGRRVLLVDVDFRKGSMLGKLGNRTEREILDLHLQNRPPAEFIQYIADFGIDYLPMPRCGVDPLELFASEQMPRLLGQLRNSYDLVIMDGPPLLGITEARLFPAMADKVLFVVKWGDTRREVAQNALRLLRETDTADKGPSDLPLAVVTQVDLEQHARYRLGDVGELLVKYRQYYTRSTEA